MSFLEKIKNFFNRLFFRRLDSSTFNNFVEDNKNEIMQNEHSKYVEDLKKSYGKEVIENKRDYKKLKFVNEIYVEPNIHDGTGFKKKTNH